jgi:hypothetical protein
MPLEGGEEGPAAETSCCLERKAESPGVPKAKQIPGFPRCLVSVSPSGGIRETVG